MVKFTGVNHLAMATGDMDRTIRFWRDLLGMTRLDVPEVRGPLDPEVDDASQL